MDYRKSRNEINYAGIFYNRSEVDALRVLPRDLKTLTVSLETKIGHSDDIFPKRPNYAGMLISIPVDFNQRAVIDGQEPPHGLSRIAASTESLWHCRLKGEFEIKMINVF